MLDIFTNLSNWCCFTDRDHASDSQTQIS